MNKKETFFNDIKTVRNILGHKHINDEYLYEFVNDYFKGWTEQAQELLLKQLKKSNPADRGALSVDSILAQLVSIENNLVRDKFSSSLEQDLARMEKNKDTEKGRKASFIYKLVRMTRNYKWEGVEKFKDYMGYENEGKFQREMILAYAQCRKDWVTETKQEKFDSFSERVDLI